MLQIGDTVKDEDKNIGVVGILWNDGDFCTIENDAAHPNPKPTQKDDIKKYLIEREKPDFDAWWMKNRAKLIKIYDKEVDPNIVIMDIAKIAWKGGRNAK